MNWYRKQKRITAAQNVSDIFREALNELNMFINEINSDLNKTKKIPQAVQYHADMNVQKLYMRCENAARKIIESLEYRDLTSAKRLHQQIVDNVNVICQTIGVCQNPEFENIMSNLSNVGIILNDAEYNVQQIPNPMKFNPNPQPQQPVPQSTARPAAAL